MTSCDRGDMKNIKRHIGKNLQNLRSVSGKTVEKLAGSLHMTKSEYRKFERGKEEFSYRQILDFCEICDTTPNEIFDMDGLKH